MAIVSAASPAGVDGMGIDVVHPISGYASITQSIGHTARCSSTVRAWRREMIRIAGAAVADNFAIDVRPTTTGMLQFFQDKRTGPLSHDKTVTFTVKGAAGLLGDVVFGDSARILPKVLTASGVMTASVPPAIITSAAPRTIV